MKKQILLGLLAAGMLAACSNDDSLNVENSNDQGEKYMSVAISLPTTRATRGVNDDYDDGIAEEYTVADATLVLFEGANESDAIVQSAYTLQSSVWNAETSTAITTSTQITQKIDRGPASSSEFFALVILNNKGILFANSNNQLMFETTPGTYTSMQGKTLAQLIDATKEAVTTGSVEDLFYTPKTTSPARPAKFFFMTNSPLANALGGSSDPTGAKVTTLVKVDKDCIKPTAAEAEASPAATIYVERAVAKVTVKDGTPTDHKTTVNNLTYSILGWELNNKNKESYLIRNVAFTDAPWGLKTTQTSVEYPHRFVSATNFGTTSAPLARTYWGIDPNYTGISLSETTTIGKGMCYWSDPSEISWLTADPATDWAYCAENTFDVAGQNDKNTTAVIVKVQFNAGADFYTVNMSDGTLYDQTNIEKYMKGAFLGNSVIASELKYLIISGKTLGESDVTLTWSSTTDAGIITLTKITVAGSKLTSGTDLEITPATTDPNKELINIVNSSAVVRRYVGGIAYYPVLIKHFGDELTPWHDAEGTGTNFPEPGNIYPSANRNANYLGRYGVLRNNWYDITISNIKNVGEATVPDLGNTNPPHEDDVLEQYISVKINILPWTKRTQNEVL